MTFPSVVQPEFRLRFLFSVLIVVVLATLFWTGSRYPALDEKAMMSGAIQLEDSLSFEARFPLTDEMNVAERVFWSTLNWINTNKKGMTFGVLFAAAFLTAASYLRVRSFVGGFANSVLGMAIGTPLGVCVNCAAPIAKGMYSAGMRAETTLSAMIASPTLNVVVLTMTFSLLPFYMAVTKIALSVLVILVLIPMICARLPTREIAAQSPEPPRWQPIDLPNSGGIEPVFQAILGVVTAYIRNLWYIIKLTVPLMLLAGFLGALVATFLPQDLILGLSFSVVALVLVAIVGVFLPVPIAFDVVMAGALLGLGLSQGYVMTLLFTLGTFSVYSFFIVGTSVGWRAAWMLAACVAVVGALGGAGTEGYHRWQTQRALDQLLQGQLHETPPYLWGAATAGTVDAPEITVSSTPLAPASPPASTGFTRHEAWTIGIDKPVEFSMRDMWPPFWEGRSLSSGDIDGDGDLDLVIASTGAGIYAYSNTGNGQFERHALPLGEMTDWPIFNAVLADMDADGWLDLVIATYRNGLWLWRNDGGTFGTNPPEKLPNQDAAPLAIALSFADVDRNGLLDIAVGNWAAGWYRRIPGEESRNRILFNGPDGFSATELPGIPGETLSILLSDLDNNGTADLVVGNDFDIPDYFYLGDGAGGFSMIAHDSGLIPQTTTTTMAIKTADLSGQAHPDIYMAQIAGRASGVSSTLKMQDLDLYCDAIKDPTAKATCASNMKIKTWYRSGNNFNPTYASKCQELSGRNRDECRAMLVKDLAIQKRDAKVCALIPKGQDVARAYCDLHFAPVRQPTAAEIALTHPQILRSNVQLQWNGMAYDDRAEARGLDVGGWSWDTKIADFDLDGDLDVYIVNGTWVPNEVSPSNLYFENDGTGQFTEKSGPMGLEDYLMTASATSFDVDGDGDLDMVTHPVNGPIIYFENNSQKRAIVIGLTDTTGNTNAIGARIALTDDNNHTQWHELQLGGGFMSFDAPLAHFGLKEDATTAQVVIRWPDGKETRLSEPVQAGNSYQITRR